jgi:Cd2+/Zn2+-exporting ATPase
MFICYDTIYNIFCYFDIRVGVKMGETIKKELILNGLHCANCANKIEKEVVDKTSVIKVAISILLLTLALVFEFHYWVELLLFLSSYLIIGWEIIYTAFKNVLKGRIFDENFLMSIATIGAFIIKEYPEAVAVMLFYQIGELFQEIAVNNSRKSIENLLKIKPDFANLIINDDIIKVNPDEVKVGEKIIVKPGEKIPLDGKVIEGSSAVDTSALTGESIPILVERDDEVLSGFINMNGLLTVEVTKEFSRSTISRILDMVQNASSKKAPTEKFITRFASYYTPVVVLAALALAVIPQFIAGRFSSIWVYRALLFLVISCPCALVISIPLGFFGGIGAASKNGILIKGSNYLEALNNLEIIAFDKTGTLTKGIFEVTMLNPKDGFTEADLLEYAAYAEYYSNHPIAMSILDYYNKISGKIIEKSFISDFVEIPGYGVKAIIKGNNIIAGNSKLMLREGILENSTDITNAIDITDTTIMHIAVDNRYAGFVSVSDVIKSDSVNAIRSLKNMGIKKTVMLTGDNKDIAMQIGNIANIDEVYAGLLPHQKVEKLEFLDKQKSPNGKMAFVGDGINDAPVLARADIGIAMGGPGSDAAMEAADIVLMTDEPSKLVKAIKISRKTKNIVVQNIVLALSVKGIVLLLGAAGIATMWEAVFADVGVALLAVLNSMRTLKYT